MKTQFFINNSEVINMEFTGERFVPSEGKDTEIVDEHFCRYLGVKSLIKDKVVLDASSGEGYGSYILSESAFSVIGIDISDDAIQHSRRKYQRSNLKFQQGTIESIPLPNNSVDVIVSYETIEHVDEETQVKFLNEAKRVLKPEGLFIISTPDTITYNSNIKNYKNEFHIREFTENEFYDFLHQSFSQVKMFYQSHNVINTISNRNSTSLKVVNPENFIENGKYLIAICGDIDLTNYAIDTLFYNKVNLYTKYIERIITLEELVQSTSQFIKEQEKELKYRDNLIIEQNEKIQEVSKWGKSLYENCDSINKELLELRNNLNLKEIENKEIKDYTFMLEEKACTNEEKVSILEEKVNILEENVYTLEEEICISYSAVNNLETVTNLLKLENNSQRSELNKIYASKMWRVAQFIYRMEREHKVVEHIVKGLVLFTKVLTGKYKIKSAKTDIIVLDNHSEYSIVEEKKNSFCNSEPVILTNCPKYDVIIYGIIDYNFRFQRPQHIAKKFAGDGHRVFYINPNLITDEDKIYKNSDGIYEVSLSSKLETRAYDINFEKNLEDFYPKLNDLILNYGIRDCVQFVEYPTWYAISKAVRRDFGFKVMVDHMDDFDGFNTSNAIMINQYHQMLKEADGVISSSQYLFNKAVNYNSNVELVRNGTEFSHFSKCNSEETISNERPQIGYYGAIAEWFDMELVIKLAMERPQYDIILIGDYSYSNISRISQISNVKLLGEINYTELPQFLKDFDVCLIPFKADLDLIKATNPVKFYEYLSAGKKIVATEIPELQIYRDQYVYLTNDHDEFIKYVDLCVTGLDGLEAPSELIELGRNNDWSDRYSKIKSFVSNVHPKVSIIIITYNNLSYSKACIESILDKTAYPNFELIVVDNYSVDGTRDYLNQLEHPLIKVILSDVNTGFAGGNNLGIDAASGEYVVLLNNDTIVTKGWISWALKYFSRNSKLGMLGPVTNSIGNEAKINVDYEKIDDMDLFAYEYTQAHLNQTYEGIKVLAMFCVFISKKAISDIGKLDDSYKIGMFEDDDYSRNMLVHGFEISCCEDVFIHHFGSVSFKKLEDEHYRKIFEENKARYEEKWDTIWVPHQYRDGVS